MKFIYLASPFSNSDKSIQQKRYEAVKDFIFDTILDNEYFIFSPIFYTYPIAQAMELPHDFDFWARRDFAVIDKSDELWVMAINGWQESVGVQTEIKYAVEIGIPVKYLAHEFEPKYNPTNIKKEIE